MPATTSAPWARRDTRSARETLRAEIVGATLAGLAATAAFVILLTEALGRLAQWVAAA